MCPHCLMIGVVAAVQLWFARSYIKDKVKAVLSHLLFWRKWKAKHDQEAGVYRVPVSGNYEAKGTLQFADGRKRDFTVPLKKAGSYCLCGCGTFVHKE